MDQVYSNAPGPRRNKSHISALGITQLHLRNPFIVAWWSAAFPGLGHLLLSKYLRGFILFAWEIIMNFESQINCGILYSFTGRFDMAKNVLNKNWLLLYIPTYLFAIWDSYRTAVNINHNFLLADREDTRMDILKLDAFEISYLDKKSPLCSLAWSAMMPGVGQLFTHKLLSSFFIMIWWIAIVYFSKFLPAIHFTLLGEFESAKSVLNPHWFMNIPSIYFFAIYDAYLETVETNKLFDWEQSTFLKKNYQDGLFTMPLNIKSYGGESMYIVSTFDHSIYLEMALTVLEAKGIEKKNILAVSMEKKNRKVKLFDSIHQSDGISFLDLPMVLASLFTIFGGLYGFVLRWGPIIWGLLGMLAGLSLGLIIKLFMVRRHRDRQRKSKSPEVVVIVECEKKQTEMIENTLWEHYALGVSKLTFENEPK